MTRARDREGGYTLSEVLVAVVILGVAIVGIVGSLGSSLFISRVNRDIVTSDATVRRYAEQLIRTSYVPCATPAQYPAMTGVPAGYTVSIVSPIQYEDGAADTPTFGPACAADGNNESQLITLEARRTSGTGLQRLQIVKRAP
jgi:prepilin-type N-terminal cleavage/methylation domain-containing protein